MSLAVFLNPPSSDGFSMQAAMFLSCFMYSIFFVGVFRLVSKNKKLTNLLVRSLIGLGIFVAIFGWIQYLFYPDLRPLYLIGWDD